MIVAILPSVTDAYGWTHGFGYIHSVTVKLVLLNPEILRTQLRGFGKLCECWVTTVANKNSASIISATVWGQGDLIKKLVQRVWFAWVSPLNLEKNVLHLGEQEPATFLLVHIHVWSCRVGRNWADVLSKCNLNNRFNYSPRTGVSSLWQMHRNFHCTS